MYSLENCFCFPDTPIYSSLGKGDNYGTISIYRPDFIIMHLYIKFVFVFVLFFFFFLFCKVFN